MYFSAFHISAVSYEWSGGISEMTVPPNRSRRSINASSPFHVLARII